MNRQNMLGMSLLTLLAFSVSKAEAGTVNFADHFNPAGSWVSQTNFSDLPGTTSTIAYQASGGIPNGYAETNTVFPGNTGQYEAAYLFQGTTYNPTTEGTITNLAMSLDTKLFSTPGVDYVRLIIKQSGNVYVDHQDLSLGNTWLTTSFASLVSTDFFENFLPLSNPAFNAGGTMEFGYLVGSNSYDGTLNHLVGVDNFEVTITNNSVPESSTTSLMLIGFVTLAGIQIRRSIGQRLEFTA